MRIYIYSIFSNKISLVTIKNCAVAKLSLRRLDGRALQPVDYMTLGKVEFE